jgi:hypothetical protein
MEMWIGMADKVTLVRVVCPALLMKLAFQDGRRSAMASTKGMRSVFLRVNNESGSQRYLHGKCTTWTKNQLCTADTWSLEQQMGVI